MTKFKLNRLALIIGASLLSNLATAADVDTTAEALKNNKQKLEVIEVTSSGRNTIATKTAMNITAMGEEELRRKNIADIKSLIKDSTVISSPGNSSRFSDSVTVRGLNVANVNANNLERFTTSTLAYYLDSTPLPNIAYRIKDVARVETLLGPQGTLYGGGSLGGTVRYITNKPQLGEFQFDFNTSIYQVKEGSISNDTDVTVNVPVSDTVAMRVNVARLDDRGFTDRKMNAVWLEDDETHFGSPDRAQELYKDDDWERTDSARIQLLWQPSDNFKVNFSHIEQDQLAHGTRGASLWDVDEACAAQGLSSEDCTYTPATAPLQVDEYTVQSVHEEYSDRGFSMSSIDLDWSLGFAELSSSTSYYTDERVGQGDYIGEGYIYYGWIDGLGADQTRESAYMTFDNSNEGISHETRLTSNSSGPLSWIVGVYYTDTDSSLKFWEHFRGLDNAMFDAWGGFDANDLYPDRKEGDIGYFEDISSSYMELALFGELSYEITDAWDVTIGARVFNWEDKAYKNISDYTGAIGITEDVSTDEGNGESIFKFNTSYDINDDNLIYFTASEGYRRGGTNGFRDEGDLSVKESTQRFEPDTTTNYELGYKGYMLDKDLYLQANIFQIEWQNTQTYYDQTLGGIFPLNGTTNGPDSESKGFEMQLRYSITDELSFKLSSATSEAEFTETKTVCLYEGADDMPGQECSTWLEGDKLGGAPKWRHNASLDYSTELGNGYLGANLRARYTDEVLSGRQTRGEDPFIFEAYTTFDASVTYGVDNWNATLWVDNIANDLTQTSYQRVAGPWGYRSINQRPRTIGLNFSYSYY